MKAFVGTVPHLPWWKLQSMTDVEIREFNRKQLVEVELDNTNNESNEHDKLVIELREWRIKYWNAAIEAAALIVQPNPHIDEERKCEDIAEAIRKLKK